MYNQQPNNQGCLTVLFSFFFIVIAFFVVFVFGIYLLLQNTFLGFLYFLAAFLLLKWWDKRRKANEQNLSNLVDFFSNLAKAETEDRKEKARIANEKEYQRKKEAFKKLPVWKQKGYSSNNEYLAEKERRLRKREQDVLLAKFFKQRRRKSKLKASLATIDSLLELTPIEFEQWVKLNIFEIDGWKVEETRTTGDGGVDLILTRNGEHSIAQCKRFRKTVGEPALRDFYGTMISEGVSRGFFVTTGLFSLSAQKFADDKPIVMIDRRLLAQKLI